MSHELNDQEWFVKDEYDPDETQSDDGSLYDTSSCPKVKQLNAFVGEKCSVCAILGVACVGAVVMMMMMMMVMSASGG